MSLLQQIRYYKPSALTLTTLMYGVLCFTLIQGSIIPIPAKLNFMPLHECMNRNIKVGSDNCSLKIIQIKQTEDECGRLDTSCSKRAHIATIIRQEAIKYLDKIERDVLSHTNNSQHITLDDKTINRIESEINARIDSMIKLPNTADYYYNFRNDIIYHWGNTYSTIEWAKKLFKTRQTKEEFITIIRTLQNNIVNTNQIVLYALLPECGCLICGYESSQAIVFPTKPYTFKGEPVLISAGIAYYNKAINPIITNNSGKIIQIENGVATLITTPKYAGKYKLYGTATLDFKDSIRIYPWQTQYYVAPKGIYMHLDNANKCYAGIPFNMTIGLEEYSSDKLSLRSKDAVIKKLNDNTYTITARKGIKSFMVYIDAINNDGSKSTSVAAKHIIVLQPTPDVAIGNIKHGTINKEYISQHTTLSAISKDEDVDIIYHIKQYDISYIRAGNKYTEPVTIQGNTLSNTNTLQSGDRIFITDVIATDNYGNTHHIPATSFRVE